MYSKNRFALAMTGHRRSTYSWLSPQVRHNALILRGGQHFISPQKYKLRFGEFKQK